MKLGCYIMSLQMKGLKITSSLFLQFNGKSIKQRVIIFDGIPDICPSHYKHDFKADIVFFNNCDKNFVYYYANKDYFPNMKALYLLSHPCGPYILRQNVDKIYLSNHYKQYKRRWANDIDSVEIKNHQDMETLMQLCL